VHLVGFIIRKFITLRGHMDVEIKIIYEEYWTWVSQVHKAQKLCVTAENPKNKIMQSQERCCLVTLTTCNRSARHCVLLLIIFPWKNM